MKKLINDTLKRRGKWSRKSLTTFTSFTLAVLTGLYIVLTLNVNMYAISVFFGFLGLGGGSLALTVLDKITPKNHDHNEFDDKLNP